MDNTKKQSFDVLECLFIRVANIKRKYQDDTDCKACAQCSFGSGATAIFYDFDDCLWYISNTKRITTNTAAQNMNRY